MAEPITVDNGDGTDYAVLVDDVTDGTLGTGAKQMVGLMDATIGATTKVAAGGGVEANALRVTIASDSTGVVSVDDGGASLTVDNAGLTELAAAIDTEVQVDVVGALPAGDNNVGNVDVETFPATVHSADFDSGAGTDTTLAFGVAVPASGGAAVVPGDATAGLKVDLGADNDVTVSGTVTVDGSGVTQPVSHAALTELAAAIDTEVQVDVVAALPAGTNNIGDVDVASIAAGDNNIGNVDVETLPSTVHSADFDTGAGTDTTLAFGLAVPASGGAAVVPGDATAGLKVDLGADNDVTVTGSVTANAGTNLNTSALALESGGNLAGAATSLAVIDDWDETDRAKVNVIAGQAGITAAAGAVAANTPRVTLASDDPAVASLAILDNIVSGSEAQVDVVAALPAGDNNIGNVDIASAIPAGSNTIGAVTPLPLASGGCDIFRSIDLDETEEEAKATAGTLYGWFIANTATSTRFVKFYNATAANVTVGTTTPVMTLPIPGNSSDDVAANALGGIGIKFDTAITVAATTGVADNDTGAPGANEVVVNLFFK